MLFNAYANTDDLNMEKKKNISRQIEEKVLNKLADLSALTQNATLAHYKRDQIEIYI
jgi:hypothetical protein